MLRSTRQLLGYSVQAKDGEVGEIDDFLFDDQSWAIRYLVVDTGNWLVDRKVLVLPAALDVPNWEAEMLTVSITRQQIEDSPPLALDQPVSRQKEAELHRYYGWPAYWTLGTTSAYPAAETEQSPQSEVEQVPENDPNLRSIEEVKGYHIEARDGQIGHVDDFIADDENWIIRYMVVDTRDWLPGKHVLISPTWVEGVTWDMRQVRVDLKRETIKHSPEFDPSIPLNREYEIRLYDYYGRPHYWVRL